MSTDLGSINGRPGTGARASGRRVMAARGTHSLLRRLVANRRTLLSGSFLLLCVLVALFAPVLAPHDYRNVIGKPLGDSGLLGTDDFGRDVFSRLLIGLRTSLMVSVAAVAVAAVLGVVLGLVAG